jgi:hypothetical protein
MIFIATQENKSDPTGTAVAAGTLAANAGKVYSITSQRDLVQTFGDPMFYSIGGSSVNGYPLNEYGLLAAYSYLGSSNLARVARANIDTAQLAATSVQPASASPAGTYWLDESQTTGTDFGLFSRASGSWVKVTPNYVVNFSTGTGNTPSNGIINLDGEIAVSFETETGTLAYWVADTGAWVKMTTVGITPGGTGGATNLDSIIITPVWPDLTLNTKQYWVKTGAAAQGVDIVLLKMSATTSQFAQQLVPVLANSVAADAYYASGTTGATGKLFADYSSGNTLVIKVGTAYAEAYSIVTTIIGSSTTPMDGPTAGTLWFNAEVGINGAGFSTVDVLVCTGNGTWDNVVLPGQIAPPAVGHVLIVEDAYTLFAQSGDPRDNPTAPTMVAGDIWVDTDLSPYPVIKRWSGTEWTLVDNTDQTSPNGIIFADARPGPLFGTNTGVNNGNGALTPDLDPDRPDADLYPRGFLLWNTRYSTNNVKQWNSTFSYGGVAATADNTNSESLGRWVTYSGNNVGGVPYMGAAAQNICVVRAIQEMITSNEEVRSEDLYFNLIAAPGYVEAIDEMLLLNEDRQMTAFVVGDSPFTLSPTGTTLQAWASNSNSTYGNGVDGLTSASKYFASWYPSGLATNVDGTDVVVPPSHMALRTIAYNDQVAYPWFAPAGLQRGVVNNATSVGYVNSTGQYITVKLSEGQRDILYQNNINPIRTMPSGGVVIFGQKTRQLYSSATDRINVVRLENYLRYQLNLLAQPFLFEPNDSVTRKAAKDAFDRFLSELITLRGLYDYLVVCDTSNNTPTRIDRNELWIDIAIQPVKAVEFIYIPVRIKNTGASLSA